MKSKAKKKKIAERNDAKRQGIPVVSKEWLFLSKEEVSLRQLYELFQDREDVLAQLWDEAGALELEIPEHKSIDLELADGNFDDVDFFAKNQVKTVFFVTIVPAEYQAASKVMKEITEKIAGVFCEDNDDFTSMIGSI